MPGGVVGDGTLTTETKGNVLSFIIGMVVGFFVARWVFKVQINDAKERRRWTRENA